MDTKTFEIKSLLIQNSIMLLALGIVLFFLIYSLSKKKSKHSLASIIWVVIVLWFFNSPFFGFSAVTISQKGIGLNYGILSLQNALLPLETPWEIKTFPSGIRKLKKVHLIQIGNRESMKVRGRDDILMLKNIGETIDQYRTR